jgi:hypothetical protein
MTPATKLPALEVISPEVQGFAAKQGVSGYIPAILEMTRQIFSDFPLQVVLEDDPEIAGDRHITLEVSVRHMDVSQALQAEYQWHEGLFAHCPAPLAPIFRLGLEVAP